MPYTSELNKSDKKKTENDNFLANTENETEIPTEIPSSFFEDSLGEELEVEMSELRAHQQGIISNTLPGFYEFQQAGYNLLHPKKVDIEALQVRVNTMQISILTHPQHKLLEQAANAFLNRFRLLRKENEWHNNSLEFINFRLAVKKAGWDEPKKWDYHQALKYANRLSGYLSGTLDLMSLIDENVQWQTPWETTRQENYDALLNELLPVNADVHNNQYAAKTRGNLTGEQPDNIKFNAIVNSVTLDERIARETLSTEIDRLSSRLLSGITLTGDYTKKTDETDQNSEIRRDIAFLCKVLQSVIHTAQYSKRLIQPEAHQLIQQKEASTKTEMAKRALRETWSTVGKNAQGAKVFGRTQSDKFHKNKHRITHAISDFAAPDTHADSHNINKAVFQVSISLLDNIQKTISDIHKTIQTSRSLQRAVTHYSELDQILSGMPKNSILDPKLRAESGKWQQRAEESKEKLQKSLEAITMLSDENMKQIYLSALREKLNTITNPMVTNNIIRDFDTQVKATVEGLSSIQKTLGQALLRLSVGGNDLDKHTASWLQQLQDIKNKLKTGIVQATGQSINNFSRQGMLARWIAEWNEAEKQRYLGVLSAESRSVIEKHYDTEFFEEIQRYIPQLSKESDPQGERLLRRLRLEMGNAAEGNTLYPATMADILAGIKSRNREIKDWSERRLIRGAFLAACLGGVKLLPNLAALPLRLPIKFAITSAKVTWRAHKGRQGVRGGEGDVKDEIAEYATQSYKTAAIKIILSLPPGLATTLGVASIAWNVYEGGLKGAGEKIAKHIIGEAPWRGLDTGSRAIAEAYVTTAITEEEITSVSQSSLLRQQTGIKEHVLAWNEYEGELKGAGEKIANHIIGEASWGVLNTGSRAAAEAYVAASIIEEETPAVNQPSLSGLETDIDALSDPNQPHVISKRAVNNTPPSQNMFQSNHYDYDRDISYHRFSDEQKKQTYVHAIQFVLLQIENDLSLPKSIRERARLARVGAKILVSVDIHGYRLNNTIFLPESLDAKSGIIIRLDSEVPYYHVNEGKDLLPDVKWAMPYNSDKRPDIFLDDGFAFIKRQNPSGLDYLEMIRRGVSSFEENFNYNSPYPMGISDLSEELADRMEADYKLKKTAITNKLLISRAIAGAHISAPYLSGPEAEVEPIYNKWDPRKYLQSFSRPITTLKREFTVAVGKSENLPPSVINQAAAQAEYIGSWLDTAVGAAISFTPEGRVLNMLQSAVDVLADLSVGKEIDPMTIASLILQCIPGEQLEAKIGKFTRIGGKAIKYGLKISNTAIDLTSIGASIKTSIDKKDPIHIFRALLNNGMNITHAYNLSSNIFTDLQTAHENKTLFLYKVGAGPSPEDNISELIPHGEDRKSPEDTQGRSPQDEVQKETYAGPSGRGREHFDLTTEHHININKFTRMVLKTKFSGEKIKTFDYESSKYKDSNNFTLAHTELDSIKDYKVLSSDTITASINEMEGKTDGLTFELEDYEGEDKEAISKNFGVIKSAFKSMKSNIDNPSHNEESDIYVLVDKNSNYESTNNHYGLADVRLSIDKSDISINDIVAHPYVIVNKYPAFRDYLIEKGGVSRSELEKYNIKNVAKYLGANAVKNKIKYYESFPSFNVKTFSFNGVNPITQRLGYKLDSISDFFSKKRQTNKLDSVDDSEGLLSNKSDIDPLQEKINYLKANTRKEFIPVKPIKKISDEKTEGAITDIMNNTGAKIVSRDITDGKNSSDYEIKNFSLEVIEAVDRSLEKVSAVKSLFDRAESEPEVKAELKALINEATGLNDEVTIDIDNVDVSDISNMAYNRFKNNVNTLHDFLSKQKEAQYNSFVVFKYQQFNSSKPDAYALPYDPKKRILLAVLPKDQRHGGLVDTVVHEASHNASYTLDHTYMGNVRGETGSFPSSFNPESRDSRHFYENARVNKLSTKYALELPDNTEPTPEQHALANVILQNSKVVKSDTLLNSAEYNAYMIDVLSRAKIKDSHISLEEANSVSKRSASGAGPELEEIVMVSSLKVTNATS